MTRASASTQLLHSKQQGSKMALESLFLGQTLLRKGCKTHPLQCIMNGLVQQFDGQQMSHVNAT